MTCRCTTQLCNGSSQIEISKIIFGIVCVLMMFFHVYWCLALNCTWIMQNEQIRISYEQLLQRSFGYFFCYFVSCYSIRNMSYSLQDIFCGWMNKNQIRTVPFGWSFYPSLMYFEYRPSNCVVSLFLTLTVSQYRIQ